MRSVLDIPILHNVPVLVRAATNVPLENGVVTNTFRLTRMLPTIEFLVSQGARVILIGHIGRHDTATLRPVYEELARMLPNISFCDEAIGPRARDAVRTLHPGEVVMFENLRRYAGETANDPAFAAELASCADVFVQDSFDTVHRAHASIVGVPALLPSYAGLLFQEEVRELTSALAPASPSLAVVSGVKFETKAPVLTKLLTSYDTVFVGGAIANVLLGASGVSIGASLAPKTDTNALYPILRSPRLLLASDAVVRGKGGTVRTVSIRDIAPDEAIVDIGPETIATLRARTQQARTILWNGPLGIFEDGFSEGTDAFARAVSESRAHSLVGGGDTVAAIERAPHKGTYSFISTGGGAMLAFIANGSLPGIRALG